MSHTIAKPALSSDVRASSTPSLSPRERFAVEAPRATAAAVSLPPAIAASLSLNPAAKMRTTTHNETSGANTPNTPRVADNPENGCTMSCWSEAIHTRSEEHTSELQSLMRISYAAFCLKKKKQKQTNIQNI